MLNSMYDVLEEQIKDLYHAENQLVKALPRMAKAASSEALRQAFANHLEETRSHVQRLEKAAETLEFRPTGKRCRAMEGLIEEARECWSEEGTGTVVDAMLVGAAQRIEHYEIAGYGNARAIARQLGRDAVADLLQKTLDEESSADKKLTSICQNEVFPAAAEVHAPA